MNKAFDDAQNNLDNPHTTTTLYVYISYQLQSAHSYFKQR